jgi:arginyl-tRNA synthetase
MIKNSIYSYLKSRLLNSIKNLYDENVLNKVDISIEKPKQKSYGDFSSPVALSVAKLVKENPLDVSKKIMTSFEWNDFFLEPDPLLEKTIINGFINFTVSRKYLQKNLIDTVFAPQEFGRNQVDRPKRILFEFVSANPTGPMVVVNGRAAAIGDTLARVNEWIGNKVEREYYINDYGNQIKLLGESIACRFYEKQGKNYPFPEGGYEGEYIIELAEEISKKHPEVAELSFDQSAEIFSKEAVNIIVEQQKKILENYRVKYDNWFRESELHKSKIPQNVVELLFKKELAYEKDGAIWFKSTLFGDEKDRVLVRKDKTPTYFLADLSYHMNKAQRGYDESYTFWGPDHHGYLPRLEGAVKACNFSNTIFKNFIIQQVNLIRDGKPFKMSKRKGDFITISDLISEVGVDAARYFFLMRKLSSHLDFDMTLAVTQSEKNPVYYVQYAHARTSSLIAHAEKQGFSFDDIKSANLDLLNEPEELDIMKRVVDFPILLNQTVELVEPQRITSYLETFASEFHTFYQKHRIVTQNRELSCARLFLTCAVRNILRLGLNLIGVSAPERM